MNGKIIIPEDKQAKLLGVTINNNLNFNSHIQEICGKVYQKTLSRLRGLHKRKESQIITEYHHGIKFPILPFDMVVL